jgi:hypothetical protein
MRKLEVRLDWGDEQVLVGTLAEQERVLYFEYDSAFITKPLPPRDHERAEKERPRHHQPLRRR